MITPVQEVWLAKLNDTDSVEIFPYDNQAKENFERIKRLLLLVLGPEVNVEHRGATSLGVAGRDKLDVFVPVKASDCKAVLVTLEQVFGESESSCHFNSSFFVTKVDTINAKIILIIDESETWRDICAFEKYIQEHPEAVREYGVLKKKSEGLSSRTYGRLKIEFFNAVLAKV